MEVARLTSHARATWIARWVAAGFAVALVLTRPLWLSDRLYPLTPVSTWLPAIAPPWDAVAHATLLALAVLVAVAPVRRGFFVALASGYLLYSLWDQQRWTPFFNEIGALMLALSTHRWASRDAATAVRAVNACGVIVALIYLWSGIQKFGASFVNGVGPWMLSPFLPESWTWAAPYLSLPMPLVETSLPFLLLSVRLRRAGILVATGMHLFIFSSAGPFGNNGNVQIWFWNFVSIALVWLCFGGRREGWRSFLAMPGFGYDKVAIVFFGIMPIFNFVRTPMFGHWDDFQAATLYSGNNVQGWIRMHIRDYSRAPTELQGLILELGDGSVIGVADGTIALPIRDWAYHDLAVPDYHARRVHEQAARRFCELVDDSATVRLRAGSKSDPWTGKREWTEKTCAELR